MPDNTEKSDSSVNIKQAVTFSSPGVYELLKLAKRYWPDRFIRAKSISYKLLDVSYDPDMKCIHISGMTKSNSATGTNRYATGGHTKIRSNTSGFRRPTTDRYGNFRTNMPDIHAHLVDMYIFQPNEADLIGPKDKLAPKQMALRSSKNQKESYAVFKPDPRTASITVRCNCDDFRFSFMYSLNLINGLYGRVIPYRRKPGSTRPRRNPRRRPGLCKHILALMKIAMDSNIFTKKVRLW